jgi:zinc transport system substrate-binding protein
LLGCSRPASDDRYSVWVSIPPQAFLVDAIAGDLVSVDVLLRPGQSPETYSPSAAKLAEVSRSDVYFGIGMPIELPIRSAIGSGMQGLQFVQTGDVIAAGHTHVHGEHCDHGTDGAQDPHIWVDPLRMIEVAKIIEDRLVAALPESADELRANGVVMRESLLALDAELKALLAAHQGQGFFINHPSLGHFAERYGLVQYSIEVAGASPSARRIADLLAMARAFQVGAVLTQPEFGRSSAEVLARELGVEVVRVDPLALDYIQNMRQIGNLIAESLNHE